MTDLITAFASPEDSVAYLKHKLAYYTDAWDLAEECQKADPDWIIVDVRSAEHYAAGHIPAAINFPHRQMNASTLATLDKSRRYITYCDGIGCNGSTKGALKLASAGYTVKELIGGLDFWRRDNHPVVIGNEPLTWPTAVDQAKCGC